MLRVMWKLLVRRPAFRRLWAAGTVSLVGDWLGFVAISRLALSEGGSALALVVVFAVHALPHAWFMPISGVVADRFDRRKVLALVPLIQAAFTVCVAAAAWWRSLALVQALVLARSACTAFITPAETAALRHTVEEDEVVAANTVLSGTWSVTFVAGMALGGIIAGLGPTPALLLDAASFLVASLIASGLPAMRPESSDLEARRGVLDVLRGVPADLRAAFSYARAPLRKDLFRAVFAKSPVALAGGVGWVLVNLVADRAKPFGAAAISLGVLQAVRGAGTGLGPLVISLFSRRVEPGRGMEHAAVILTCAGIFFFPMTQSMPWLLLFVALVWGMGGGSNWVLSSSSLQRLAPGDMVGRLSSLDEFTTTAAMVAGAFLGAFFLDSGWEMQLAAGVAALLGLASWVWLSLRGRFGALSTTAAVATRLP